MFKQIDFDGNKKVRITFNGESVEVSEGISVAAAVLSLQQRFTRTTPESGTKRAPFCMMGVCYECLMIINNQPNQRACSTAVEAGMSVEIQHGTGTQLGGQDVK